MFVFNHHEDLQILNENVLPRRAYYVPASRPMGPLVRDRELSDRLHMLNGQWSFRYFESTYDVPEQFYLGEDLANGYEEIPVPSVWQNLGFDSHQYTNIRYPIPLDPPHVPQENPCGAYIRDFEYAPTPEAPRVHLNFEGVDSCYYVWLNGRYVGYSQISHATSEFDVTDLLVPGTNRLAVLVLKWGVGTYLEDQDKFRTSGIFRDVYLLERPESAIFDYFTTTQIHPDRAVVRVRASFTSEPIPARIALTDATGEPIAAAELEHTPDDDEYTHSAELEIPAPHLWNAEDPYLYTLTIETERETIVDRVGVRNVRTNGNVIQVNDQDIRFRGVNRHDSDPVTGPAINLDQLMTDLRMMKQHNVNAIRSSHYPNSPYFYQLCDELGFYVLDEADNESHGTQAQYLADLSFPNQVLHWNERIADNPDFLPASMDRMQACVRREKNRPSIVMWSAGNECAYGITFEESLRWTKEFDPSRLTVYESSFYDDKKRKYDYSVIDVYSRMYPALTEVQEYLDSQPDKPFLLLEYCHAMGNGPGDFEDYLEIIESNPAMCGGFVWEWCDHAVYKGTTEDGRAIYYYGGDHGEIIHDSNFCVDGLVSPDRQPHVGLLEFANVHRPVRAAGFNQATGELRLRNNLDFTNLAGLVSVSYEVTRDGEVIESGTIESLPSIPPRATGSVHCGITIPDSGRCYLTVTYHLIGATELVPAGHSLGFDEILLEVADPRNQAALKLLEADDDHSHALDVQADERFITISGGAFEYVLDRTNGLFRTMSVGGEPLLTRPMELNIWRAPTDNDMYIKEKWQLAQYPHARARAYSTECSVSPDGVTVTSSMALLAPAVQRIAQIDTVWHVSAAGAVHVDMTVRKDPEFPMFPRFGLRLFLDGTFDQVTYYGLGPFESYPDKHRASSHGRYSSTVLGLHVDYLRPQENGSHHDCDYVIAGNAARAIAAVGDGTFSFNASPYTQEQLDDATHNVDLAFSGETVWCLDYAQNGIGSNSCGPEVLEKYRLDAPEFRFALTLVPSASVPSTIPQHENEVNA
ncbi:MAG: DUF4981 domain-containing protein [Ruaniaceae bacterium]|nr:DUF4981 domain-containing protein [Ruaniaceae bacterium]